MEKLSKIEAELEKGVAYKKSLYIHVKNFQEINFSVAKQIATSYVGTLLSTLLCWLVGRRILQFSKKKFLLEP